MTPRVSIIIPCYNKEAYVRASIKSALEQTEPCEVIVVDDGSIDGSLAEIKRFDGRIIWETRANSGGSAARNRGLTLARGEYIQFLDADDIMPPNKVATQLAVLDKHGKNALAFCPWSMFSDDCASSPPEPRIYWRDYNSGLSLLIDMWLYGGFFPPHVWLASRALIEAAGPWDETLTGDDDGEFFGRLLMHSAQVRFCAETEAHYRDPPDGSVSRSVSLESGRSFWKAFEQVSGMILQHRNDRKARRALLSRARKTAYAWRFLPEIVGCAECFERELDLFDFSPALPGAMRWIVGFLGIQRGLKVRQLLKREEPLIVS